MTGREYAELSSITIMSPPKFTANHLSARRADNHDDQHTGTAVCNDPLCAAGAGNDDDWSGLVSSCIWNLDRETAQSG